MANQIGINTSEFWKMTLKEFYLFLEGYREKIKIENEMQDRRTARICMVMANLQRDSKKRRKPYSEDDFIPKPKKKMTVEQIEIMLKGLTYAMGGEVIE